MVNPEEEGMRWGFEQLAQMQEVAEMGEAEHAAVAEVIPTT
jgi:hypothetical protein